MAISQELSLKMRRISFFCTLTVVWVHSFNLDDRYLWPGYKLSVFDWNSFFQLWIGNSLFRFAIPLFFLISGFLMAEREGRLSYSVMLQKRAKSLLVPYVAWSIVGLGLTFWWEADSFLNQFVVSASLRPFGNLALHQFSWQQWLEAWLLHPVSFQLWFLRSLFLYSALYPLLAKVALNYPRWFFGISGMLWLLNSGIFFLDGDGLLFFSLGIWIQKTGFQIEQVRLRYPLALFSLVLFFITIGKTMLAFVPGDWTFPTAYLLHKFHQPLLIVFVWLIFDRLPKQNPGHWFDTLSATNFFIYGAHVPLVYYVTDWLFLHLGKGPETRLTIFLLLPFFTIISLATLALLLKRFLPIIFKIFSGWRNYPTFTR